MIFTWAHRAEIKQPFEERPIRQILLMDAITALFDAKAMKMAEKMDQWSDFQQKLISWLTRQEENGI